MSRFGLRDEICKRELMTCWACVVLSVWRALTVRPCGYRIGMLGRLRVAPQPIVAACSEPAFHAHAKSMFIFSKECNSGHVVALCVDGRFLYSRRLAVKISSTRRCEISELSMVERRAHQFNATLDLGWRTAVASVRSVAPLPHA